VGQRIYTSATPGPYEQKMSEQVEGMIVRQTGLIDPEVIVRPIREAGKYAGQARLPSSDGEATGGQAKKIAAKKEEVSQSTGASVVPLITSLQLVINLDVTWDDGFGSESIKVGQGASICLKDELLPDVANSVHEFYYADKVYFVGYEPIDKKFWQTTLMYLNAALGTELQGDLHIVIVQNAKISAEKDAYITALKAYWSDPKVFGDDTVSKNPIIVVVGTEDGQTVSWARATTGMPLGNEYMLNQIQNKLPGTALTPEALIGIVNGEFYTTVNDKNETKLKVRGLHGNGILNRLLWGLDDAQTKFKRVSMTGNSEDDNGNGFLYLADELEPSDGEKILFAIIGFGVSMLVWAGAILYGERIQKFTGRFRRNSIFGDQNTWR